MTDDTQRLAREWARKIKSVPVVNYGLQANAAAEHILATTEPTMADIGWNEEEHALAGATLNYGGEPVEVVMLAYEDGCISYATSEGTRTSAHLKYFTPNGKCYELREVGATAEPAHPGYLETLEDYENAPEGTIAVLTEGLGYPIMKHFGKWWRNGISFSNDDISKDTREVLRWGWGK